MGKIFLHNPRNETEKRACENCHGPGSEHVAAGGGKGVGGMITFRKDSGESPEVQNEPCLGCHQRGIQTFWKASTHAGRGLTCVSCHTLMEKTSGKQLTKQTEVTPYGVNRAEIEVCAADAARDRRRDLGIAEIDLGLAQGGLRLQVGGAGLARGGLALVQCRLGDGVASDQLARALKLAHSTLQHLPNVQTIHVDGASSLLDHGPHEGVSTVTLRALFEMMEEKERMMHLLNAYIDGPGLTVVIGTEHTSPDLRRFSLIACTAVEGSTTRTVGVIGPTRMHYSRTIALVDGTTQAVSRVLRDAH
jgi:hypothetical protein